MFGNFLSQLSRYLKNRIIETTLNAELPEQHGHEKNPPKTDYKNFSGMSMPENMYSTTSAKVKESDCSTINGHDESLSIRTLMKDAVKFSFADRIIDIPYVLQIFFTGSVPFKHQRLQFINNISYCLYSFQSAMALYSLKSSP